MNRKTRRLTNANHNAHGLYFHSSVPKVYPHAEDFGKIQYEFNKNVQSKANALVIKPSNIRIWIHDKDIDKLMRVVLEGHGQKLRNEMASTPKVKRFLSYVPHFMGVIKSIHAAVIENNIELVRAKTSPPVPPQMLNCKDVNGLTPLHKAAGLGHTKIVEYLIETWPNLMHETDSNGKTALHYAAAAKNNDRTFNLLVQAGSDELAMDVKGRNAAFYKKGKNGEEIDRSLLTVIPDAARVSEQGFPPSFSWDFLPAKFFDAPIKATQSHMNLSAPTESHMKQSNSAFEIISRTESVDDVNDNEPIKEEEFKVVDEAPIMTAKDLNNNSAKVSRSPERQEEDFEAEEEKTNLTDTETLFSEQKLNGKFNHQDIDDNNFSNEVDSDDVLNNEEITTTESQENEQNTLEESSKIDDDVKVNEDILDTNDDVKSQEEENAVEESTIQDSNDHHSNLKIEETQNDVQVQDNENELNLPQNEDRAKSSDTYDIANEVDQDIKIDPFKGEEIPLDSHVDILIIDRNEINEESEEELLSDKEIKSVQREFEVEEFDDNDDVVVSPQRNLSADLTKPTKTGDSTKDEDEQMDEYGDIGSPSPPFEGVIKEEAEKQLESNGSEFEEIKQDSDEPQDEVQKIINAGDMEELAVLVLNGDGSKLVGRKSSQPDIQAFLENIPLYMVKIRKVHLAAREGSLRDLQAALDRRKFSTAKDESSPKGASPLHVAIIFGHTAIIRYLGSRFPETVSAADDENRTSLHYAATLNDNGHFYNLLVTLGADSKAVDSFGHTPEFYLNHDESDKILSHKDLLRRFGAAETLADEMLNDQELKSSQQPVEIPLFRTEEGRYLATSLGDPLIKGLTEVANQRPHNPIQFLANYLQNFVNEGGMQKAPKEEVKTVEIKQVKPKSVTKAAVIQRKARSIENLMDEDEYDATPGADERDEHGQSMLHFAAARQHGKNALFQLIEESGVSLSYRDEIYRTARDVSLQASQPDNCKEIDRYVLSLAARGDYETFVMMLLDGYDHIIDVCDSDGFEISQVAKSRGHHELAKFLNDLTEFEKNRERLLHAIRQDDIETVKEVLDRNDGNKLARAKNYYGRCSLHVAVLLENEEIVDYIASNFRQTLKVGDNLERTALHYSMGINNVEAISRILIKNGAKRVLKDLKGRTASFYYMNKGDISRLQEEEKN